MPRDEPREYHLRLLADLMKLSNLSPATRAKLIAMRQKLRAGESLAGKDLEYLQGCHVALYADSAEKETTLFKIRHALIQSEGNVTAAAAKLRMYFGDVWAYIEDHPEIFDDILKKKRINPHLLDTLQRKQTAETMTRAIEIAGTKQGAAKILGMKRTTLVEQYQKLTGANDGSDS